MGWKRRMADEEERDENATDEEWLLVVLGVNIWLKGKQDPLFAFMRVRFTEDTKPDTIEELTDSYANIVLQHMNSRSAFALTLEDDRENRFMVSLEQIQAIQVVAPDTMPEVLTKESE